MNPASPLSVDCGGGFARRRGGGGFTLLEIMMVVCLMGLILMVGIPAFVRTVEKEPLQQAVSDLVEALGTARAQAILSGQAAEMILRADGHMGVVSVPREVPQPPLERSDPMRLEEDPLAAGTLFDAVLGSDVAITFLGVNLTERMEAPEVRVRFHPNGTSDHFVAVLEDVTGVFSIEVDEITGIAEVTRVR